MPHKFNASRRHKFAKKKYRVTNWNVYNESLRNRGDLTVWITADAQKHWAAPRRGLRGGQPRYSDLAITMCLTLGMVYKLPLRQTQGLMRSISKLMRLKVPVPDFSTLSRRPVSCSRLDLAGRSRLSSRHHETRPQARHPYPSFPFEIATLPKFKPMVAWRGKPAAVTINAAGLRHKWAVGRPP